MRGQYFFGTAPGSDVVGMEGELDRFAPLPVLDWYFNRALALLAARGIDVEFGSCPSAWCKSGAPEQRWLRDQAATAGRLMVAVSLTEPSVSRLM
jgi:hypothetical protein